MEPYNLAKLYKSFSRYTNDMVLYLPRNSDLNQLARYAHNGKKLEVAHYTIMGASKVSFLLVIFRMLRIRSANGYGCQALCVYFGDFDFEMEEEKQEEA